MPDDPLVASVLLKFVSVDGEGAGVVEDDPGVGDGGVEGAGGSGNSVKTHLLRVLTRSKPSWLSLNIEVSSPVLAPVSAPPEGLVASEASSSDTTSTKVTFLPAATSGLGIGLLALSGWSLGP